MIKAMYSGLDHTRVVHTLVQTFGLCTRVWTDTCVDTSPRTPLSVGLVYLPLLFLGRKYGPTPSSKLRFLILFLWKWAVLTASDGPEGMEKLPPGALEMPQVVIMFGYNCFILMHTLIVTVTYLLFSYYCVCLHYVFISFFQCLYLTWYYT